MKLRDDNMVYLDNDIKLYINDCLIGRGRIEDQISASYDYDTLAECFIEYMDELKLILRDDENGL